MGSHHSVFHIEIEGALSYTRLGLRIDPRAEKQTHPLPAYCVFLGAFWVNMNKKFWHEMRKEGFTLVDSPKRKLAVFANTCGMVVIATEDDGKCVCTLDVDEIDGLIALLQEAKHEAAPIDADIQASFAIHCAKIGESANG